MTCVALRVSIFIAAAASVSAATDERTKWQECLHAGTEALEAGEYAQARVKYAEAMKCLEPLDAGDLRKAVMDAALGSLELSVGHEAQAESLFVEALPIFEKHGMQGAPEYGEVLADLGAVRVNQGRWKESESLFKQSLAVFAKSGRENEIHATTTLTHLANLYVTEARPRDALPLLEQALAAQEKAQPATRNGLLYTLHALGGFWLSQGQFDRAEPYLVRAWELSRAFPEGNLAIADGATHLGALYFLQGKTGRAKSLLNSGLSLYERRLGDDRIQLGPVLTTLARIDMSERHYAMAEEKLGRVLAIFEKSDPPGSVTQGLAEVNLAEAFIDDRQFAQAQPLLEKGIATLRAAYGGMHPNLAAALFEMGRLRAGQKDVQQADAYFREAIAGYEETSSKADPLLAGMLRAYAAFLKGNRRSSEAKTIEARANAIFAFRNQ
jgi:tetratricopeptide (TPR) repeat protein